MRVIVTVGLLALGSGELSSQEDTEWLARAEAAFTEGLQRRAAGERGQADFRRAAHALEELRRRGANGPLLYLDLGNAYLLAGDLPRAILAYRTGLRIDPENARLQEALAIARDRVIFSEGEGLGRPAEPAQSGWLARLGQGTLLLVIVGVHLLACLLLTRWFMVRRRSLLVAGVLGAALVVLVATVYVQRWRTQEIRPVVVVARDGVALRMGNSKWFPAWTPTPLNRGVEAEVLYRDRQWLQIQLLSGEVGWLDAAEVVGPE